MRKIRAHRNNRESAWGGLIRKVPPSAQKLSLTSTPQGFRLKGGILSGAEAPLKTTRGRRKEPSSEEKGSACPTLFSKRGGIFSLKIRLGNREK